MTLDVFQSNDDYLVCFFIEKKDTESRLEKQRMDLFSTDFQNWINEKKVARFFQE